MTRVTPDYDEAELVVRTTRRRTQMHLDGKSILSAVGQVIREDRAARGAAIADQERINVELREQIMALQNRIETLERRTPSRPRAVGE